MACTYIYGAGNMGRLVLAQWRRMGQEVDGFIDRAAGMRPPIEGVPVVRLNRAALDGATVLVALHNPGSDVAAVVAELQRAGCSDVRTLWQLSREIGWTPPGAFWLAPWLDDASTRERIAQVRAALADAASVRVFDEQLALRTAGNYHGLSLPTLDDQYMPSDLPRWQEPLHLVDCGAFDGDTLRAFDAAGYVVASAWALEPDPTNHARLLSQVSQRPHVTALRSGAHSGTGRLAFAADGAGSAHLDVSGADQIDVVALDDLPIGQVNLIKMDIEGAEAAALEGALHLLTEHRPSLAVSLYHRPADLWELPAWLDNLGIGYKFHMRSHGFNGFDTVLYARVP